MTKIVTRIKTKQNSYNIYLLLEI